jgi:hypothetical protein
VVEDAVRQHLLAIVREDRLRVDEASDGALRLPAYATTEQWLNADEVTKAAGDPAALIAAPSVPLDSDRRRTLHLLESPGWIDGNGWLRLDQLDRLAESAAVRAAIRSGFDAYRRPETRPPQRPEWFAVGWRAEVDHWIDSQLSRLGLSRRGPSRPIKFWSLSAVLEVPVAGAERTDGRVFFKAACEHFRSEAAITGLVARLLPAHVPEVLALDEARSWMLLSPLPGLPTRQPRPEDAVKAAAALARLQLIMLDHLGELTAAGAPDRTLQPTLDDLAWLVADSVELDVLTAEERALAREALPWLGDQLAVLAGAGLPYTIGHGDLHLDNLAADDDRLVIYDWTDAALTFPTLDCVVLAASAGRAHQEDIVAAYVGEWRTGYAGVDFEALRGPSMITCRVFQAISYERIYRSQERVPYGDLAGVVAGTLRDLGQQWAERRYQ